MSQKVACHISREVPEKFWCEDVWRGRKASALATPVTLACSEMLKQVNSVKRPHVTA